MSELEKWCWLLIKIVVSIGTIVVLYTLATGALVWIVFFVVLFGLIKSKN